MINTARTTYEGRTYEIAADSTKANEAMFQYVVVRRVRKDGKPGRRIVGATLEYTIWSAVRDQIKALEAFAAEDAARAARVEMFRAIGRNNADEAIDQVAAYGDITNAAYAYEQNIHDTIVEQHPDATSDDVDTAIAAFATVIHTRTA